MFFFFNDTATTEIYTLSLHDALPIYRIAQHDTVRVTKDGRRVDVSVSISPIADERGEILGAATIARDVTERRRDEVRLRFLAEVGEVLAASLDYQTTLQRSEERRVGKECRSRWSPYH